MPLWCVAKQLYCSEAKLPSHCRNIGQRVTDKLLKVANYSAARVSAHLGNTATFSTELVLLDHCFPYKLFFLVCVCVCVVCVCLCVCSSNRNAVNHFTCKSV